MAIYRLGEHQPRLESGAWVAHSASVVGQVALGAVAGVVGIGLYRLLMRGAVYDRARPQTRRFPMTGLTDARADLRDGDSLVLRIEYDTFRGTLHFKPDGGPDALRAALQRRGVRVRAR